MLKEIGYGDIFIIKSSNGRKLLNKCHTALDAFILQPPKNKCLWGISIKAVLTYHECVNKILYAAHYPRIKGNEKNEHFCIIDNLLQSNLNSNILEKNLPALNFFLLRNANFNFSFISKKIAFEQAARHGYLNILGLLWRQKLHLTPKDLYSALREASANGHLETIKFLIAIGANINYESRETSYSFQNLDLIGNHDGQYPHLGNQYPHLGNVKQNDVFFLANRHCVYPTFEFFVSGTSHEQYIHAYNDYILDLHSVVHVEKSDVLLLAAENGHRRVVEFLISKGADIHVNNDYILEWAVRHDHLSLVEKLFTKANESKKIYERNIIAIAYQLAVSEKMRKYLKSQMGWKRLYLKFTNCSNNINSKSKRRRYRCIPQLWVVP